MVCADTALTCAVRELNETLQAGPSGWLVDVVVPVVVALATLAVAVGSLVIAARANKVAEESKLVAEQVREDSIDRDSRREREALLEEIPTLVAAWQAFHESKTTQRAREVGRTSSRLDSYARSMASPGGAELVDLVDDLMRGKDGEDMSDADLVGGRNAAEFFARLWVRHPEVLTTGEDLYRLLRDSFEGRLPEGFDE